MRSTVRDLLRALPPFNNRSVLVESVQDVPDIMREVINAHRVFGEDYDTIFEFFLCDDIQIVCEQLFDFCKANIRYAVESEHEQTTKSPAAILAMGYGDCKHYAAFIAGVLDAIKRNTGENIRWVYRFASYDYLNSDPGHVFVVVFNGDQEIWIDPVLQNFDERLLPAYVTDKKINAMPLYRLSGVDSVGGSSYPGEYDDMLSRLMPGGATIGWTMETSAGYTTSGPAIVPQVGHSYFGNDFLGLSRYGSLSNTDLNQLTAQLQSLINEGPAPHQLPASLVNKVSKENMQHWNFFYNTGTSPTPRLWQSDPDLQNFLMLTITPDGRLTYDRNEEPPHNAPQIHKLADWANYLIQAYSDEPYYVTIEHLKRLGKGWNTPNEGSLWHVIHTGDVHAAKLDEWIDKIPGLKQLIDTFGIDIEQLINFATRLLGGDGSGPTLPGGVPWNGGVKSGNNSMIIAAVAAVIAYMISKKIVIAGAVGVGSYMLLKDQRSAGSTYSPPLVTYGK